MVKVSISEISVPNDLDESAMMATIDDRAVGNSTLKVAGANVMSATNGADAAWEPRNA